METQISAKGLGKMRDKKYHLWQYDSLFEFADVANSNPDKGFSARYDRSYNLTASYEQAHELCKHGWHDIRPTVDKHLDPLREKLADVLSVQTERVVDMVGYEPDIDRYLAGELECMWDDMMVETPKSGKVFTMLVDASMSWMNSPEDIAKRGAVLCGLTEAFIMLGFQLEIWVESTITAHGDKHEFVSRLIRVNTAGDPIDIDSIMFAIGHPDFNRRMIWSHGEMNPIIRNGFGFHPGGYYGVCRQGAHMAERVGASLVVSLDGNTELTRDPLKWILDQLEIQGIYEGGE